MSGIIANLYVATGAVVHHMDVADGSNNGTLCGVSTDDDLYAWIDAPSGKKIHFMHCVSKWVNRVTLPRVVSGSSQYDLCQAGKKRCLKIQLMTAKFP